MTEKSKKVLLPAAAGLALVTVTLLLVRGIPGLQRVLIQADTSGFKVEVGADGRLDIAGLLDRVSEDRINRDGMLKWLKDNWGLYPLTDVDLVDALMKKCPPFPLDDFAAYQAHVESCERDKVVGRLRNLASGRKPPFQRKAKPISIGTPRLREPQAGEAFTCFEGEWENKRLRLLLEEMPQAETPRQIEVVARGGYECLPGAHYPDLQINGRQAHKLFGRPTREKETAIAVVL